MKKILIGSVVALSTYSALVYADQVINDDLIVTFSTCVGNDCVNGESFGFDTIRLKENNTRIKFQDTSNSASFPTVDWQLTANDSSNGGANKFSIDDIDNARVPFTVEAGARNNALYVEADGQVGLGTNNPVTTLHGVHGNTPTLRLEQDGSSGFTPQTWDIAGNETNFFVRDATNGSSLPFRIRPGSGNNNALYIDSDGDIGMGDATPDAALDIESGDLLLTSGNVIANGTIRADYNGGTDSGQILLRPEVGAIEIASGDNAVSYIDFKDGVTNDYDGRILYNGSSHAFQFYTTTGVENAIIANDGSVNATAFNVTSDYRLKDNIINIKNPLARLTSLSVHQYNYTNKPDTKVEGFLAHELAKVAPYAVTGSKDEIDSNGQPIYQTIDYSKLVPLLTASVQELTNKVNELEVRIEILKKQNK